MKRRYGLVAAIGLLVATAWLVFALRGDFRWSTTTDEPVWQSIGERFPATLELAFLAFVAVVVAGGLIGVGRARARSSALRQAFRTFALAGRSVPVLMLAPALQLGLMFWGVVTGPVVPVLALAVPFGAWSSLIFYDAFRSADGGTLRTSSRVVLGAVAATAAWVGPAVLAATVFIEPTFAWPGVGRLFTNAVSPFDPGLIAGLLLTYSVAVLLLRLCERFAYVPDRPPSPRAGAPVHRAGPRPRALSPTAVIAFAVLAAASVCAAAVNLFIPMDPNFIDQANWQGYPLAPGVAGHLLGTDENGRDLLARLLFGLRTSLGITAFAAVIATAIGAAVAKTAPWFADRAPPALAGIRPFAALPFVFAALTVLVGRAHSVSVVNPLTLALIIAAVSSPALVPALHSFDRAAAGAVAAVAGCALLLEVSLSMSGYGVQPPGPSLGNMLVNARSNLTLAPWTVLVPAVTIIATLCALYAIADLLPERA
ncbi:MAG TPA: hypothetical protein VFF00_02855 [Candidatus Elarobacter sp.]|nr:hypothetical protein [Candidatus Elarobacter sp.]